MRELYARHGVREYWIVDPDAETIHVLRQHHGALEEAHTFDRTRNLHTALLPGFEVDLRDIFA
jgi:Uma2 family endonuclease